MATQISCIVTFHIEGALVQKTLRALEQSVQYAQDRGIDTETVAVLDKADRDTRERVLAFSSGALNLTCIETDLGDVAPARNAGIETARGRYVSILDGDDIFAENWLYKAYRMGERDPRFVVHPEFSVCFDRRNILVPHTSQLAPNFSYSNYLFESYWTALGFARRDTFLKFPYLRTDKKSGFGYEDWHWNCEVMAHGYVHVLAPKTVQFVRLKQGNSRNEEARSEHLLMPHSTLFDKHSLLRTLCNQ